MTYPLHPPICGELLWKDGGAIAACAQRFGTEHSHSDDDVVVAVLNGLAFDLRVLSADTDVPLRLDVASLAQRLPVPAIARCRWCDEKVVSADGPLLLALGVEPDVVVALARRPGISDDERVWVLEDGSSVCTYHGVGEHGEDVAGPHETYRSQSARDAHLADYGGRDYWTYLDAHAHELHDYFMAKGDPDTAAEMFTRSLAGALRGNDGD